MTTLNARAWTRRRSRAHAGRSWTRPTRALQSGPCPRRRRCAESPRPTAARCFCTNSTHEYSVLSVHVRVLRAELTASAARGSCRGTEEAGGWPVGARNLHEDLRWDEREHRVELLARYLPVFVHVQMAEQALRGTTSEPVRNTFLVTLISFALVHTLRTDSSSCAHAPRRSGPSSLCRWERCAAPRDRWCRLRPCRTRRTGPPGADARAPPAPYAPHLPSAALSPSACVSRRFVCICVRKGELTVRL